MGYCGKPSAGCATCRQRKIKCDRGEPACQHCIKAGWKCPGYRTSIDLLFHDESEKVVKKFHAAKEKAKHGRTISNQALSIRNGNKARPQLLPIELGGLTNHEIGVKQRVPNLENPALAPLPNVEALGIGFFFHYYVVRRPSDLETWATLERDSWLLAAITALGVAGVTKTSPGEATSRQVRSHYLTAINLVNEALQSPTAVTKDTTLLAVNLLGIFEANNAFEGNFDPWRNHINGAASLLQYRGAEQFSTSDGARVFLQTVNLLIVSCIERRFPIPIHVHRLMKEAAKMTPDPTDRVWRCLVLSLRFADLYARLLPNNIPRSWEDAESIITDASSIDRDMLVVLNDTSDEWKYVSIPANEPMVFAGYVYAFPTNFTAMHCNNIFYRRIVLHDIMLKAFRAHPNRESLSLSEPTLQRIKHASTVIRQLQLDILASIPQHLGAPFTQIDFLAPFTTFAATFTKRDELWPNFLMKDQNPWRFYKSSQFSVPFVRSNCGFALHWPLYIAGAADRVDGRVRSWAVRMLKLLGEERGVQQAILLADTLRKGEGEQLNTHCDFLV